MLVGSMNFPGRSVAKEIHRIHEEGFDFVDLTLEPTAAWLPDGKEVAGLLGDLGLGVVGHTPWYLPFASPFPELRAVARELYVRALDVFADAGVELVNIHCDAKVPMHSIDKVRSMNADAVEAMAREASARDIRLMVENLDRLFSGPDDLRPVLDAVPDAGFHLDIGHANLNLGLGEPNRLTALLDAFGERLAHVHVSDNRGGSQDLHLPLGAGAINWKQAIRALKDVGFDGTVTLEVFSRERAHLTTSRRLWLQWWSEYS